MDEQEIQALINENADLKARLDESIQQMTEVTEKLNQLSEYQRLEALKSSDPRAFLQESGWQDTFSHKEDQAALQAKLDELQAKFEETQTLVDGLLNENLLHGVTIGALRRKEANPNFLQALDGGSIDLESMIASLRKHMAEGEFNEEQESRFHDLMEQAVKEKLSSLPASGEVSVTVEKENPNEEEEGKNKNLKAALKAASSKKEGASEEGKKNLAEALGSLA